MVISQLQDIRGEDYNKGHNWYVGAIGQVKTALIRGSNIN
jgi:hypothetical protein